MRVVYVVLSSIIIGALCQYLVHVLEDIHVYSETEREVLFNDSKVLIVISHPDDEIMFFTPTLIYLNESIKRIRSEVFILCLSTGNYYNQGQIREQEFEHLFSKSFPLFRSRILNNSLLQDGPDKEWSKEVIKQEIDKIRRLDFSFDLILTFDTYGISHHINHIQTSIGVQHWFSKYPHEDKVNLYLLRTISFNENLLWFLSEPLQEDSVSVVSISFKAFSLMTSFYKSQLTWYRCLYLIFSRYSFINTYIPG